MSQSSQSAAERAMNAAPPIRKVFGQVKFVECVDVGFDESQRRYTPWNPAVHQRQQPRTQVTIEAEVYKRAGTYVAKKEMIDNGKEWQEITRASMIKLNLTLSNLQGRWVEIELRRTGRTWADKNTGETKYAEAFYFTRVFPGRDECDTAYAEHIGAYNTSDQPASDQGGSASSGDVPTNGNQGDAMQSGAVTIWKVTQQNPDVFKATIAANPMLMAHFGTADAALAYVQGAEQPEQSAAPKKGKNVPQPVAADAGTAAGDPEEEDLPF